MTTIAAALELVVVARDEIAEGVVSLLLERADGGRLPAWTPGAHIDLVLTDALVRQYSLCGDPADDTQWRIAVLREAVSRGGSEHLHSVVGVGTKLCARGPRNNFELEPASEYLFIAGGIGITPLLPMVRATALTSATWRLVYGGRSTAAMAFRDELATFADSVTIWPQDALGLLDLDDLLSEPVPGTFIYCCGPEPLLKAVEQRCTAWPVGALHLERFAPRVIADAATAREFTVELASTGQLLTVSAEKSVLQTLEEAGVGVLSSCREGTCGTCETGVLAGDVDHRDSLLTPAEQAANDVMFVCVSRARSELLVLDL